MTDNQTLPANTKPQHTVIGSIIIVILSVIIYIFAGLIFFTGQFGAIAPTFSDRIIGAAGLIYVTISLYFNFRDIRKPGFFK
jgi:hypothetical protein